MANPALSPTRFAALADTTSTTALTRGAVVRSLGVLLAVLLAGAALSWSHLASAVVGASTHTVSSSPNTQLLVLALLAFAAGLAFVLVPKAAVVLAPVYALLEGGVLGAISFVYNAVYPGVVLEAVGATVSVLGVFAALYLSGTVKVTSRMRTTITAATLGVLVFYLVAWIVSLFTSTNVLYMGGPLGIAISVVTASIASLNLFLDFDFIDRQIAAGAPASSHWYAAGGTVVTLAWIYIEMLRLLAKLNRR
jgi:uncharacterized YccA/Bax inhibitor family protein